MLRSIRFNRINFQVLLPAFNPRIMTKRRSNEVKDCTKTPKNHRAQNTEVKKTCASICPRLKTKAELSYKVQYLTPPRKAENDKKEYRVMRLANGLTAVLVSDTPTVDLKAEDVSILDNESASESESDVESGSEEEEGEEIVMSGDEGHEASSSRAKLAQEEKLAALSLCVGVGSFSDPWEIPGMAHFLEHMVFMGSAKYPKENDFDSYVKKRGGSDNASTECEFTTFYFECQERHLSDIMDRFAQFFISPLMKRDAMTREREAIESEFQLAMPSHYNRKQQLLASMAKPQHPAGKFSWGNLKTLKEDVSDDVLYEAVHAFRKRYYSAHRMTLAVQARLPLQTLEEWVIKYFSSVPNNDLPPDDFTPFINNSFDTPEFRKIYHVDPVKDICQVELTWALPPMQKFYRSKPDHYVASVLGYEGPGSLLSFLRQKVWALDIYTGNDESGTEHNSMYSLFEVTLVLTEEGHQNFERVLECLFGYINMLKLNGPSERIFNELKTIEDTGFRFTEEVPSSDYVEMLAENMQQYPPEDFITGPTLFFEYNPQAIADLVDMLVPESVNIVVASKDPLADFKFQEKWFGTRYTCADIPTKWLTTWKNAKPDPYFTLPPPNIFLTNNFDLIRFPSTVPKYPSKIHEDKLMEVWYRPDDKFRLPIAFIYFYFLSPLPLMSPVNCVMLELYVALINQQMVETLYPAEEALLNTSVYASDKGLILKVDGYNEKLHLLIDTVIKHMVNFENNLNQRMFDAMKEEQIKSYYNNFLKPRKMVKEMRFSIVMQVYWSGLDKHNAVQSVSLEMVRAFSKEFRKNLFIQCLVQGNVSSAEAQKICADAAKKLECRSLSPNMWPSLRVCQLPIGDYYCKVLSFNSEDVNSVVTNYYQSGPATIKDMCIVELLMLLMEEPLFNILRTKEQLGYHVFNMLRDTFGILGFSITVNCQADKHTTEHVDERIESFLKSFYNKLKKMPDKELERAKHTIIKLKQCVDLHLKDEVSRNWDEITTADYVFDRLEKEVACIQKLSFGDLRKWISRHIAYGNKNNYRKLSCQVSGHDKGKKKTASKEKTEKTSVNSQSQIETSNETGDFDCSLSPAPGAASTANGASLGSLEAVTSTPASIQEPQKPGKMVKSQYTLQLLIGSNKESNQYITDMNKFKKKLYIYPQNNIVA